LSISTSLEFLPWDTLLPKHAINRSLPESRRYRRRWTQIVLAEYLRALVEQERRGDAREESHYPALKTLLERTAAQGGRPDVRVTVMPQRTAAGDVDFQVWGERQRWVGSVEAKRPGTDLRPVEESAQVLRYLETFENLLLTNFHEFRIYRSGHLVAKAAVHELPWLPDELADDEGGLTSVPGEVELLGLLERFFDFAVPRPLSAEALALQLARRARLLAREIADLLAAGESPELAGFLTACSEHLIRGLEAPEFADLYAQTVAYGLLAVRFGEGEGFGRRSLTEVPRGNGLLRDLLRYLSLEELRPEVAWIVDDIVELLREAPVRDILLRYFHENRGKDPIHHFYETFLTEYDPRLRRSRGVYYTPPELVSYLVSSVHGLLVEKLGWKDGLADQRVRLLDPAAGTLTFVVAALGTAIGAYRRAHGDAAVPALIREHLLVHAFAFEVMMAPYAMGHLKLHLVLAEAGYPLRDDERIPFYLTNALDRRELVQSSLPGASALSREARAAAEIKGDEPINVVLGNPPYSGHSFNRFPEKEDEVDDWLKIGYSTARGGFNEGYYRVDGRPLGERNPKWLQDDYVKFLRFAQWKIDQAGEGIVAFVTNHSYLDNPTFRGLRRSLLRTFDELYFLDLHGNRKKQEKVPGGGRDENVFEIEQGVAIALLVKKPGLAKRVFHADRYDVRREKLAWLNGHDRATTEWKEIAPRAPAYLFVAGGEAQETTYWRGVPLPAIFPLHSAGIVTARDDFVLDFDRRELVARIGRFRLRAGEVNGRFGGLADTGSFRVEEAYRELRDDDKWFERFHPLLYRPFDGRTIFYADYLVERPRRAVMDHLLAGPNLGLICPKQHKEEPGALVTDRLAGHKAVSAYDINDLFPLYLYPEPGGLETARQANVARGFLAALTSAYGAPPSPEDLLAYVYAVLYSPPYRDRYRDLLRRGFPRISFPANPGLFERMASFGSELIALHLLPPRLPAPPAVRFEGKGSGKVGTTKRASRDYRPEVGSVFVNGEGQYFTGIPSEVWAYRVGGYQVLDRWLASRAGRLLTREEIEAFATAAAAIERTIAVERKLAEVYPEIEESLLALPESCAPPAL